MGEEERIDNKNNIEKLREQLKIKMSDRLRIEKLNLLRYYLSEEEEEQEKVKYDQEKDKLIYSESIQIGIVLINRIEEIINEEAKREETDFGYIERLNDIMKENYYYLARYIYSYYAIAMEFGIPKKKQFLAPRTCVLNYINWELSKFYYKDRGIMTISMPQGTGKEQPLSSKILTPNGWTTMGELEIGSEVIAADGKAAKVTGIYPKGIKDVYRVKFNDGTYVDCGLEHLWEVSDMKGRKEINKNRSASKNRMIMSTEEMLKEGISFCSKNKKYNKYSVRLVQPIEYNNQLDEDDLNPYLLGILIGNKAIYKDNQIRITIYDDEIIENIKRELPKTDTIYRESIFDYKYIIMKKPNVRDKTIKNYSSKTELKLKEYGLLYQDSTKRFIPNKYLYSGKPEERIKLLRGIIDILKGKNINEKCGIYYTSSENLLHDMLELIRGLGGICTYSKAERNYKKRNGEKKQRRSMYEIQFRMQMNPASIKRKAENHRALYRNTKKMIVSIEKVRQEECQCIMIDHPDHLYVTDGYTLTHNTENGKRFMSFCIGKNPDLPNMMVSYSASIAKDKFYNGIITLIEDENGNFQKIFPKLKIIYKNAETMSIDCRNDNKKRPHSEYSLYCAGFDGSITGRTRAHGVLYVDDLVKNIEEARNKDVMDKKWEEFTGTLKKRMQGQCKLLIIGTIFSVNDPLSRIISYYKEKYPERIKVVKIPRIK